MLITAHDALKSAADSEADNKIPEVDKKFEVAIDLLYHFVKDFPTLNPNIRNLTFKLPKTTRSGSKSPFAVLYALRRNIHSPVEFLSDSLSLNADES